METLISRVRFSAVPTLWLALLAVFARAEEPRISFNREIRPIQAENCLACHGLDAGQRKGELRLDTLEGAHGKGKSGKVAIVPGDAGVSELWTRIITTHADEVMPPPKTHKSLTVAQKELIKRWIAEGATYEPHWAFIPPQRPTLPAVAKQEWVRNPVVHFILATLERESLAPAPEAERTTLLRRVTLDLTGLPPTPAEQSAFLADASPQAYEQVVDRLMATRDYAERQAQDWLDWPVIRIREVSQTTRLRMFRPIGNG